MSAMNPSRSSDSVAWLAPILRPPVSEDDTGQVDPSLLGRIAHYEIESVIGRGGMGVVLQGHDPTLGRPIALKVLSPHLAGVGAARSRFKREAKAAAAIIHPSVVPIYAIETEVELPCLVMPLIEGENLQQRIDRDGPLPLDEVLRIGVSVAEGIVAAHGRGVIHRDIKPANLLIEKRTGRVMISDFGLARALDDATITMSGMIAGTPSYMSPQQARGETSTPDSDWFSFGAVLYAMATGRPPHRAECPLAVLRKITDTDARPIHEINEVMPPWLDRLVSLLMCRDSNRSPTVGDDAVERLRAAHLHVTNPSVNPLPASLRRSRRHGNWKTMALVLSLISVASAAFAWLSQPQTVDPIGASISRPDSIASPNANLPSQTLVQPRTVVSVPTDEPETRWRDTTLESLIQQLSRDLSRYETNP